MKKNTDELLNILNTSGPGGLQQYLNDNATDLIPEERPFAAYMRATLAAHGVRQQEVFLRVGISQSFGYQLISEEKRTRQRDYILKLCIAGGFTLNETQRAVRLYGMAPLYARFPRDAVLIAAFQQGTTSIEAVDDLLRSHGMEPL